MAVALVAWALAFPALAGQVSLAWDSSPGPTVVGYYLYYGVASQTYTSQIDVGNQTSYTVSNLTPGQVYFFAVTAYDAGRNESPHSNEASATIAAPPAAQTSLASSANPATFGLGVTFTATVTGTAPTGTVRFSANGTTIGGCNAAALVGGGNVRTATCATASLAVGTHNIVASYAGDGSNGASSSAPVSQVVGLAATSTTLTSSLNPSALGASVTFTASVTGSAPSGTVNFTDGGTSISGCSARSLGGTGNTRTATCATASLSVATHSIVANYAGDGSNTVSSSAPVAQAVGKASTSTTLASSPNPSALGASVTFTASVTGSAPTGTVSFSANGTTISGCNAAALVGGGNVRTATCATASLAVATHSIVASYAGDASNAVSSSTPVSQVVGLASTSTTVTSSLNPSALGASVTFTASVTGSTPTGAVNFTDGGTSISGCSAQSLGGTGNTRTATCTTSALTSGTHSIVASYAGDASNAVSSSTPVSQVVGLASTSTTVASSLNPSALGASVTFTASVTGSAPIGTVSFSANGTTISGCNAAALVGGGNVKTATCVTASLAVGTHNIVASYAGDGSNAASSSAPVSQVVGLAGTSTTLSTSLNPSGLGASVTFTASVTGSAPTGAINFTDGGTSISGCSAQSLGGAGNTRTATCTTASLPVATHNIVASYAGDGSNGASSSAPVSQVVGKASTTASVTSSLNPSALGASVTFTASVTGSAPTGAVNFTDGGASISGCSAQTLGGTGNTRTATCTTASLAVATHSIVASYAGDASNAVSSSTPVSQVVGKASTTASVTSSLNPSALGASVTFTASVTGSAPTGTVNFTDGGTSISGCSARTLGGTGNTRTATCTTSALTSGTHSIVASYAGDGSNGASSSAPVSQVVGKASTNTTVASSLNPSALGASVTFTASVTGSAPSGTVNFTDGGTSISGCSARSLGGTGNTRTATCTTSALTSGTHSIVASYAGDASNAVSTSTPVSQVVGKASTSTAIASSLNPSALGASVTFTASVTGSAPSGTVNFMDGGTSISGCSARSLGGTGNTRTATCTTSALTSGTHSIVASYVGDAGNAVSTSVPASQVVGLASTTNGLASSLNPSTVAASVTFTASVTGSAPTGTVNFKNGGTSISGCSARSLGGTGNTRTATCTTSALTSGTHTIVASYAGNAANASSSSAPLAQVVSKASTSTTLASSLNPASHGASVKLTASVTGSAPTGTVNFTDGGASISGCSARTLGGSGNTRTATCTTTSLGSGTHSIVASYAGNATNATSTSATLSQMVVAPPATFADVPAGHWAFGAIEAITYHSITLGCASNPLRFCPDGDIGRDEMAVFLERATRGLGYPFAPTGVLFADVPITHWAVGPIEQLYSDGITLGCGASPLRFCPATNVTRAEIAIFLLRARFGPGYNPASATGLVFADVPATHWAAKWIEAFAALGYTAGCRATPHDFCPNDVVTRAGMAVFLQRVFNLAGPPP